MRVTQRLLDVDHAGFDDFVREQQLPLLRLAVVYSGDRHLAEDVVQDVLARLFSRRGAAPHEPAAYARKMVLNELRSRARLRSASEVLTGHVADRAVQDPDPFEREHALRLLRGLPHRQKVVLILRYIDDWSDSKIAQSLGCSQLAVRLLAKRGLDRIRTAMPTDRARESA